MDDMVEEGRRKRREERRGEAQLKTTLRNLVENPIFFIGAYR
jgi:hypothetical protein